MRVLGHAPAQITAVTAAAANGRTARVRPAEIKAKTLATATAEMITNGRPGPVVRRLNSRGAATCRSASVAAAKKPVTTPAALARRVVLVVRQQGHEGAGRVE